MFGTYFYGELLKKILTLLFWVSAPSVLVGIVIGWIIWGW